MRQRKTTFRVTRVIIIALMLSTISLSAEAADRAPKRSTQKAKAVLEHEIVQGETLGAIAIKYGITQQALMDENQLDNADKIFFGQKLKIPGNPKDGIRTKNGVLVSVPKGFTLSRVAAAYSVSLHSIIRANKLQNPDAIREGQKLLIPGATRIVELVPPPPCLKNPISIYRVRTDETMELSLSFCSGRPNMDALQKLSTITDSVRKATNIKLHPRLARLLQQISERYPGKRIEIISGQRDRKQKNHESYHNKGRALDFRVEGISNYHLSQYVRGFTNVGVGYYPNSVFIHMDVRSKDAYWIDYSAPGERSIYARKGLSNDELQKIREKRRERRARRKLRNSQAKRKQIIEKLFPEKELTDSKPAAADTLASKESSSDTAPTS